MKVALQTSVRLIASLALISYKQKYLSQSAKQQVGWEERGRAKTFIDVGFCIYWKCCQSISAHLYPYAAN